MLSLEKINTPIKDEMNHFNDYFKSSMKSTIPLLNVIINYVLRRKGKQMRPMFVFLSAKLVGEIRQSTYTAAALIELLHTATLIHDDVVDESYERRGFFSIFALWKSKIAVLIGDYLLTQGLLLALNNKEYDLLEIVSDAVKEMIEGELIQIQKSRKLNITEEEYFDVIRKKTATLIAAGSACGTRSVGSDDDTVEKMKRFGEYVGIAFQIKDDLFDYQKNGKLGKPTANDIKEKKLTLPLIHALSVAPQKEKKQILKFVKNHKKNAKNLGRILDFVNHYGGIDYSTGKMNDYKEKALNILAEFPDNEAKKSLQDLVHFTTTRKK